MVKKSTYVLDATLIVQTIERLRARIEARVPASGLGRVCTGLVDVAKLAALYASETEDADILVAVNDMEELTTSLGRKIWQKIIIIGQLGERTAATEA